ncbi:hypothetical protein [Dactylosporangium darangshiense]|uniref:Integral membrane protein n=1 Tax=Dactylosporangium darangshiense TaxID=579108 RepID=A0ABP8DM29_9ACTN
MRRLLAVAGLLVLAPLVGEYLLGNLSVRLLPALPFLAPLYGGGALLIREIARRTGAGWPAIFLLGAAYGVVEAGLVDQSMFNPGFEGHEFQAVTPIPALGISAYNTLAFVAGHAIWSIAVPIALVEHQSGDRGPWLGRFGWPAAALLYVFGCRIVYVEVRDSEHFIASPAQRIGACIAALLLATAAFAAKCRAASPHRHFGLFACQEKCRFCRQLPPPPAWLTAVIAFAATSVFFARPESWAGFGTGMAMLAAGAAWLARTRWSDAHRAALAAGALLTYAWAGFALTQLMEPGDPVRWYGNAALAALAVALVAACALRRPAPPSPPPASAERSTG